MSDLHWKHETPTRWDAFDGPVRVGEVVVGRAFNVRSADDSVHGTHRTLEAAKAQIEALSRWRNC